MTDKPTVVPFAGKKPAPVNEDALRILAELVDRVQNGAVTSIAIAWTGPQDEGDTYAHLGDGLALLGAVQLMHTQLTLDLLAEGDD